MSGFMLLEIVCFAFAMIVVVLRLTRWRTVPQSRPFTVASTFLMLGVALRHPRLLTSSWLDTRSAADVHLANFTDLLGDLLVAAAACYMGMLVVRAWGMEKYAPWIRRAVTAAALAMVMLWSISNAPTTPAKYVGTLGGPATIYSYVAATTILLAHASIVVTIGVVRVPRNIRLALLPLALAASLGVIVNFLRITSHISPDIVGTLRDRVDWPISLAMILLYAISGLVGYLMTSSTRSRRDAPLARDARG
ncbi:hypothetical protein [Nocardia sp. NPDC127526]|uniref:hypothetical protein n=1 Tax=Nocardia sp. NPDC127526 TaxID=3345393 RepID=UPI00362A9F3F